MQIGIGEFMDRLSGRIAEMLPDDLKGCSVRTEEKLKNNGVTLHGIAVVPQGTSAVPLVYADGSYSQYLQGRSLDDIAQEILRVTEEYRSQASAIRVPDLDMDSIGGRLRAKVISDRENRQMLDKLVSRPVGCGFSLTAYIDLTLDEGVDGMIQITKDLAAANGYDAAHVMDIALANSARLDPPQLRDLSDVLSEDEKKNILDDAQGHTGSGLMVLSHQSSSFGAVALFYPGIRDKIAEAAHGDFFVLPGSVHEVIIVPDTGEYEASRLMDMVELVNSIMLSDEDRLADRVLHYRSDIGCLTVAAEPERDDEREACLE